MKIKRARPKVSIRFPLPDILAATKNLYLVHALSILLYFSLSLVATNLLPTSSKISPRRCFEKFVQRRIRRRGGGGWETTRERLFHAFSFSINAFYLHYGTFCFAPFFFLMILLSGCNRFNVYVDLDYFL